MLKYAGIGSRETPPDMCDELRLAARELASLGALLRSGGAPGADLACEDGCDEGNGLKEIFLPWASFSDRPRAKGTCFVGVTEAAFKLASEHHDYWHRCGRGAMMLLARNGYQVLGRELNDPVDFVLCWTPNGSGSGGTGQAIRIARKRDIPIYDFGAADGKQRFYAFLETIKN